MDINFISDPNLLPKPRPDIKVESIHASPIEGGRRLRLELQITPFAPMDRPNILVEAFDPHGDSCGSTAVVESMHNNVAMTFHLRGDVLPPGPYRIVASVYFEEEAVQGASEITLDLPGDSA